MGKNIGFISTRLAGIDGVSLETNKWADVLERRGHDCFWFAGELVKDPQKSFLIPEAHFQHPHNLWINERVYGKNNRQPYVTREIHSLRSFLKTKLRKFIDHFNLDLLIVENALAIPLNIPLGIALAELISETRIATIAHHHDFYWERDRFMTNGVWDYLHMAFPPNLPTIDHVVINSFADEQLSLRKGISATVMPNIMDFENPPPAIDDYASDVRQALGVQEDELLVLQPTRVVARKGIEMAIELIHRLGMNAKLVISHASGDEGYDYEQRLKEYADLMNVNTLFVSDIINEQRGTTKDGRKIYTLEDIYPHADLITYPSTFEGFGNAFLEAVYFRKPVVVNEYSIYTKDIKPKGFDVIELPGYVTAAAVEKTKAFLKDPKRIETAVNRNYEIGLRFFSYEVLERQLKHYIATHMALRGV